MVSRWDRAATYLGIKPADADTLVTPRSWFARIGTPGPDTSALEQVIGLIFLVVLIVAWIAIVVTDTSIAIRVLAALAVVADATMIVARLKLLLGR